MSTIYSEAHRHDRTMNRRRMQILLIERKAYSSIALMPTYVADEESTILKT
jgi:hypothetical protein